MPTPQIISYTQASASPKTGGKVFWVSATSGALWNDWNINYPPDPDGINRVHTSITLALAATVAGRGDFIELAPDFTTAATTAEIALAELNGVTIMQDGKNYQLGPWFAERATAALPAGTSTSLFTVTGRVKLIDIQGLVTTKIQDQACTAQLSVLDTSPTALGSTAICAATSIRNNTTRTLYSITGTFANSLVTSINAAVFQAAPTTLVGPSLIKLQTSATNTGSVKWRVDYVPLEAGARVFAA